MSSPRAPLARSTLLKMGARIAVVIVLSTLFSYMHMLHTLRAEALEELAQHVAERGTREEAIFLLAEDNHSALKQALEERIRSLAQEDVDARFERLFVRLPDGTVRNRPEGFDGTRHTGLFVPRGVDLDAGLRRRILASYDVLNQYGPAFRVRFVDSFIVLPEGPLLVYWPERPNYVQEAAPDLSLVSLEYFLTSLPEANSKRETRWSSIYLEEVSAQWMTTATTPLDMEGRHVASISHDILLDDLMARTLGEHLPSAYNVILREDGGLIAHPGLDRSAPPGQHGSAEQQVHLRHLLERITTREPGQATMELPEHGEYMAVTRLHGTGWYFATLLPEHVMTQPAIRAARIVLVLGVL
ncbi:MAG TPA: histidine kinase, partial [Cystobacter sp.]